MHSVESTSHVLMSKFFGIEFLISKQGEDTLGTSILKQYQVCTGGNGSSLINLQL